MFDSFWAAICAQRFTCKTGELLDNHLLVTRQCRYMKTDSLMSVNLLSKCDKLHKQLMQDSVEGNLAYKLIAWKYARSSRQKSTHSTSSHLRAHHA